MTADEQEVAELYRKLGPTIYRRCLRLLKTREAAQDATQEVFLKILKYPRRFGSDENALPFIYQTATHYCLNVVRDAGRREKKHFAFDLAPTPMMDTFPERQLTQQILSRFDQTTQAVALGSLVDGMEQAELAEALGVSSKTVSRKLSRFLANSRKFLRRIDDD